MHTHQRLSRVKIIRINFNVNATEYCFTLNHMFANTTLENVAYLLIMLRWYTRCDSLRLSMDVFAAERSDYQYAQRPIHFAALSKRKKKTIYITRPYLRYYYTSRRTILIDLHVILSSTLFTLGNIQITCHLRKCFIYRLSSDFSSENQDLGYDTRSHERINLNSLGHD